MWKTGQQSQDLGREGRWLTLLNTHPSNGLSTLCHAVKLSHVPTLARVPLVFLVALFGVACPAASAADAPLLIAVPCRATPAPLALDGRLTDDWDAAVTINASAQGGATLYTRPCAWTSVAHGASLPWNGAAEGGLTP